MIVTAVPLYDEGDEPFAVLEMYRDVTAESRMQANYRGLLERERRRNELLAAEVRRRTEQLEGVNGELKDALRQVSQLAQTDPLTGVFNRRFFQEEIEKSLQKALHRAVLGTAGLWVELLTDAAGGEPLFIPKDFHDGKFGVGQARIGHVGGS